MTNFFKYLQDLEDEQTAHLQGKKKVFLRKTDTPDKLLQFAHGSLAKGEETDMHAHQSMEEYFYFIDGAGEYIIDNQIIPLKAGTFVNIPSKTSHQLKASLDEGLTFVYFGIESE